MIEAIVFDLDGTLFDPGTLPEATLTPVFDAVRAANEVAGWVERDELEGAIQRSLTSAFDAVSRDFRLPQGLRHAWSAAMAEVELPDALSPFPDVACLEGLRAKRYLVTTGFARFQEQKLDRLGLRPLFRSVWIDAVDGGESDGKPKIFRHILASEGLTPSKTMVVGDSWASELSAGAGLGMRTVQVVRPSRPRLSSVDHCVDSLCALEALALGAPHRDVTPSG